MKGIILLMSRLPPRLVTKDYNPEFGTSSNAQDVQNGIELIRNKISKAIGAELPQQILDIVHSPEGENETKKDICLSNRELRIVSYALARAINTI